jgi:hypothetical protein
MLSDLSDKKVSYLGTPSLTLSQIETQFPSTSVDELEPPYGHIILAVACLALGSCACKIKVTAPCFFVLLVFVGFGGRGRVNWLPMHGSTSIQPLHAVPIFQLVSFLFDLCENVQHA